MVPKAPTFLCLLLCACSAGRAFAQSFDPQTSQGECVQALSIVPSDVPIDGLDCGEGGGGGAGLSGGGTCPADDQGPAALSFLGQVMLQAVQSGDANSAALITSYASAIVAAKFLSVTLSSDPTCLSRAPPYFAALGEAVQASAAQACGGNAGTPLAKAVADAPTVMAQAVAPQEAALAASPSGAQQAVYIAAEAVYPGFLQGYKQLIAGCTGAGGGSTPAGGVAGSLPADGGSP